MQDICQLSDSRLQAEEGAHSAYEQRETKAGCHARQELGGPSAGCNYRQLMAAWFFIQVTSMTDRQA